MVKRLMVAAVAIFLTLGVAGNASAGVVASLDFTDPSGNPDTGGIVGPSDVIPVWLTLTLGVGSDPLTTDATSVVTSPLPAISDINLFSGLPGNVDVNSDSLAFEVNESAGCGGTFCTSPAYTFNFNFDAPAFVTPANLDLVNPGDHYTWELGTFTPTGGPAPAGTYNFNGASVDFYVSDLNVIDPNSGFPIVIGTVPVANTFGDNPGFERTVVDPAPEPGTWMLMLTGLVLTGGAVRRRVKTAAV